MNQSNIVVMRDAVSPRVIGDKWPRISSRDADFILGAPAIVRAQGRSPVVANDDIFFVVMGA